MTTKDATKQLIDTLPDEATLDEIIRELYCRATFDTGEQEIRDGKGGLRKTRPRSDSRIGQVICGHRPRWTMPREPHEHRWLAMSSDKGKLLREALNLSPIERAKLVEDILQSFEFKSREEVDALWAAEAKERIDAHDRGHIRAVPAKDILDGIERKHS